MQQFPNAFEFNDHLLCVILDHLYSCLFGTFLYNNHKERTSMRVKEETQSLWSFVNSKQRSLFLNPMFTKPGGSRVAIFPIASIRCPWSYVPFWDDHSYFAGTWSFGKAIIVDGTQNYNHRTQLMRGFRLPLIFQKNLKYMFCHHYQQSLIFCYNRHAELLKLREQMNPKVWPVWKNWKCLQTTKALLQYKKPPINIYPSAVRHNLQKIMLTIWWKTMSLIGYPATTMKHHFQTFSPGLRNNQCFISIPRKPVLPPSAVTIMNFVNSNTICIHMLDVAYGKICCQVTTDTW